MVPDARFPVAPLSAILLAAPVTTLNVRGLPVPAASAPPEPVADAVIVIEPGALPVMVSMAIPADAVTGPRLVTVPVPAVFANVTLRELSAPEVMVLSLASLMVAVRVRVTPAVRSPVASALRFSLVAGPAMVVMTALVPVNCVGVLLSVAVT